MQALDSLWCFRLGSLSRKMARMYNHQFSKLGITIGQSFVLYCLREQDGRQVKDIASAVQLDSPSVTGLVDRLMKEGLVIREEDPQNRRNVNVFMTDKGQKVASAAALIFNEFNNYLKQNLPTSAETFETILESLDSTINTFDSIE